MKSETQPIAESIEQTLVGALGFCVFATVGVSQAVVGWIGETVWARAGYAGASLSLALIFLGLAFHGFTQLRRRRRAGNNR